jgi:hypothetical protein
MPAPVYLKLSGNLSDGEIRIGRMEKPERGFIKLPEQAAEELVQALLKSARTPEMANQIAKLHFKKHPRSASTKNSPDKIQSKTKKLTRKPLPAANTKRIWVRFVQGGAPGLGKRA